MRQLRGSEARVGCYRGAGFGAGGGRGARLRQVLNAEGLGSGRMCEKGEGGGRWRGGTLGRGGWGRGSVSLSGNSGLKEGAKAGYLRIVARLLRDKGSM